MRKSITLMLCVLAINTFAQTGHESNSEIKLSTRNDSMNYFFGITLGYSLQEAPFKPNADLITEGLKEVLQDRSQYDQETGRKIFQELHRDLTLEESGEDGMAANENLRKGNAFLIENGKREEVTTTNSGLQYEAITVGEGPKPTATSTVEVHYEGTLIDGTVFDSSYDRGEPISFPLDRVIAGWTEGVQQMPVGSTFKFYIPAYLAYGERAAGSIPPNSVLIFKIELLGIK